MKSEVEKAFVYASDASYPEGTDLRPYLNFFADADPTDPVEGVDEIRQAARTYATTKPAFALNGMGQEQLENCIEISVYRRRHDRNK